MFVNVHGNASSRFVAEVGIVVITGNDRCSGLVSDNWHAAAYYRRNLVEVAFWNETINLVGGRHVGGAIDVHLVLGVRRILSLIVHGIVGNPKY